VSARIYTFQIDLSWQLLHRIREIEKFELIWTAVQKREHSTLRQLKALATVQSIGSSTRIEGSSLTDVQVQTLLDQIDITEVKDRDSQEVVGYYNVLDLILDSVDDLIMSESIIKNLHKILLQVSDKDAWHRGDYKKHSNAVQANFPDGSTQIIFKTTDPGHATQDAMRSLLEWYREDSDTQVIIKLAAFVYEFLSIHPFQDGNGRLSRLLTTLLLLRSGYDWVAYVSFEHEIESQKKEYYKVLRNCQAQRPNEDITQWIEFFLSSMVRMTQKLSRHVDLIAPNLTPKQNTVLQYIRNHPECKTGEIIEHTQIPRSTAKRIIVALLEQNYLRSHGKGRGVIYTAT